MLFVILVKENPALPHNMQKSFMSTTVSVEALPAPLDGCPGVIPGKGFLENNCHTAICQPQNRARKRMRG